MIKRTGKSKKSKQGSMLIIVVLILALAMIFISSAMMLTQATKGRLYSNALSSQARLTVTAASEVFLEALETQEITDVQLEMMLKGVDYKTHPEPKVGQHSRDNCIKMVISGVPGMGGADGNCTYLDLYYPDAADLTVVNADFTTVIGDETENVRIVLKYKDEEPGHTGRFKNQIDVGGAITTSQLRMTGGLGEVNPALGDVDDNTILFRGNAYEQTSSSVFFSDLVFADGAYASFGGGNKYYGSTIFLENAYLSPNAGTPNLFSGNFYFIGKTKNDAGIVYNNGGSGDNFWKPEIFGENANFVFSGRIAQKDTTSDQNQKIRDIIKNKSCYFVDSEDNTVAAWNKQGEYSLNNKAKSGVPDDIQHKLDVYTAYDYSKASEPYPDDIVEDVFLEFNVDGKTKTIEAGTTLAYDEYGTDGTLYKASESPFTEDIEVFLHPITKTFPDYAETEGIKKELKLDALSGDVIALTPGYYYVTGSTSGPSDSGVPYHVIAIDGSQATDYRFYFSAEAHFIGNTVFAVYNVQDNPAPVVFVIEPGGSIKFSSANYRDANKLCTCGFVSVKRGFTTATTLANYIKTTKIGKLEEAGGEEKVWDEDKTDGDGNVCSYSKYYDGILKPSIFIFGSGCDFSVGDCTTLEAYIGLYETSTWSQRNDLDNSKTNKVAIYGRIEVDTFSNGDNPTGYMQMPYCPAPSITTPIPKERAAVTKYHVTNVIYYYDNPDDADDT